MMNIIIPSRFSLLAILFLILSPFILPQTSFAQDELATTVAEKESPRFFGARRGALPDVKQGIARGETSLVPAYQALLRVADEALEIKPPTVTNKKRHPVTGNLNDYYTQAPYLWPDPSKSDGLPYLPKDGIINPESRNPDFADYSRGHEIGHLVESLALAYYLSGEESYAAHAARCLRVWFINPATRMNPHLKYAQAVPGRNQGRYIGMIEAGGVVKAVDAAGLLDGSRHWSEDDRAALEIWISEFLDWFMNSDYGREEIQMRQNHGTMFDVRVVRMALALGKYDLARERLESVKENRIARQIEPDGAQPMELRRTKSFNYSEMNLTGLTELATLGEWVGVDLWTYETADGRSIRRALEFLRPYVEEVPEGWPPRVWHYKQVVPFLPEILAPAFRMASIGYQDEEYEAIVSQFPSFRESSFQLKHPKRSF
ncbi:alginate lyase family protein [Hyunsoonleella sp. SJ7]|uniref:Alginate lyase family protein n=1 Tax=Hyunsoonleella aquatilis TaxID=2762758 RepID=A0A923KJ11_9FLAO|nr:alginate lyase family protein [Hyunsoonleella aquatilis]MBC3756772.1 alginate lyase family protein [Hyunsoonleella aquatilis]